MSAELEVIVTRTREVSNPLWSTASYYGRDRQTKTVTETLAHISGLMDDEAAASMLRGLADVLDPPPEADMSLPGGAA